MIKVNANRDLFMSILRFNTRMQNQLPAPVQNNYVFHSPHEIIEKWKIISELQEEFNTIVHQLRDHYVKSGVPIELLLGEADALSYLAMSEKINGSK